MNEIGGMLNSILSNPDEMKKIMDVASQIMGNQGGGTPEPAPAASQPSPPSLDHMLAEISKNPEGLAAAAQSLLGNGGLQNLLGGGNSGGGGGLGNLLGSGGLSSLLGGGGLGKLLGGGGLSSLLGGGSLGKIFKNPTVQKIMDSPIAKQFLGSPSVKNLALGGGGKNDKQELIRALKPWLSEERAKRLDKAMVFAKVMRFAGATALIGGGLKDDAV